MGTPLVEFAPIALQPNADAVLQAAATTARDIVGADSAFVAVRDTDGRYPLRVRLGLTDPAWPRVQIRAGRGLGGMSLLDQMARTTHDYLEEPSITGDYQQIMRREQLRGLAVVPIHDVRVKPANGTPIGLIYVSTHLRGAPGDRVVEEVHRVAEMAAVGLAHLGCPPRMQDADHGGLTSREREVLVRLSEGDSNRAIAQRLVIAQPTVKGHVRAILRKLDAPSRLAAVAIAQRRGIL